MKLYHSKVNAPNFRRSAPQLNPGVARMHIGKGVQQAGEALFEVGEKMHQVNVARQVATAMAEYKMKEVEFLAKMQNADPSKVNFTEEFNKFYTAQGSLSQGVSRDASELISNRIKAYGASTFGQVKRTELRNQADLVLAEAPVILENLAREQAEAELVGDGVRAERAQSEYNAWVAATEPALPPGAVARLKSGYKEMLGKQRHDVEKQAVYNALLTNSDPKFAHEVIEGSEYLTPEERFRMRNTANANREQKIKKAKIQVDALHNEQTGAMLDSFLETGDVVVDPDMSDALIPATNAVTEAVAAGGVKSDPDDLHPLYYIHKDKLQKMSVKEPFVTDKELWEAASVLPKEEIEELRTMNRINEKIFPRRKEVAAHVSHIKANMNAMVDTVNDFDDYDTSEIIKSELRAEYDLLVEETKQMVADGKDRREITDWLTKKFDGKDKGIMKNWWSRKFRKGTFDFTDKYRLGQFGTNAEGTRRIRRQGMMHLLADDENWEHELGDAIQADRWFDGEIMPSKPEPKAVSKPRAVAREKVFIFADEDKFWVAPTHGLSESDAIFEAIETGDKKGFDSEAEAKAYIKGN